MRKLLTILTMLVAFASQGWADDPEITVWVGKQAISYSESYPGIQYNTADTLSTMFSGLATGDVIKIYTSTSYDSGQQYVLTYRGSGWTWTDLNTTVSDGTISYTVENDDIANYIAERGLIIRGQAFDMDKITITKTGGSLGTSWAGYVSISWDTNSYPGVQFDTNGQMNIPDLVAGDIIRITTTAEGEGFQYALNYKDGNWDWIAVSSGNVSYSEHVISYTVESDDVATFIKERGLIIKGIYFHIKSIEVSKLQYTLSATAANGSIKIGDTDTDFSSGSYDRNSSITLIAVPADGYRFVNWTDDNNSNNEISTSANYTFTLTANTALTAHFIQQFTLTTSATGGSISVSTDSGSSTTTETTFDTGTTLTLTATPATGYNFTKWQIGEEDAGTSTTLTHIITEDVTITAVFSIQTFSVTASSSDTSMGTVALSSGSSGDSFNYGSSLTITGTPNNGYEFVSWSKTENASWSSTSNPLTIEEITATWTLTGTFQDKAFTTPEGETLLSNTATTMGDYAGDLHISTDTYNTYKVGDVIKVYVKSVTDGAQVAIQNRNTWSAMNSETSLATDATVFSWTVTGAENVEKMNSSGLKITGKNYTAWGVTIIPLPTGVKNLSTGSKKINGSTSVTIPKTMFANAVAGDVITVNVSSVQSGAKYTLKGWSQDEREGDNNKNWSSFAYEQDLATDATSFTCTLTADILDIIQNAGLSIEGGTYTCGNVTLTTAYDVPDAQTHSNPIYTLTVTEPVGGTVTIKKGTETVSAGAFEIDTELTLTATAADGYVFKKWTKDGTALDDTSNPLTITMTADVTMAAVFKGNALTYEERRTLWTSTDGETLSWSDMMAQSTEVGDIVEAGEILIVTAKSVDTSEGHYPKISLRDASGNEIGKIDPLVAGENKLSITSTMATAMANGFKFQGESAVLTKLELYKPTPITALEEEETKTLWSNTSGTALTWNNTIAIDRAAEWGAVLEEDERIIISVKSKETGDNVWPTVQLQNDTEKIASTANLLNDMTVPCDITITLTAEMVNKMKNGFSITGDGATITKVVLYKPTMPTKTVHTLNSTETAISGDANVTVAAEKFAKISAYDVLTVNFTITTSPANVIIKGNGEDGGWDYLKEMKFENGETLFALPLTPAMTSNLKKNGLQITGSGYTFKSVTIKTAGEVPSDEEKKGDEEKDDEEKIIDKKTGEADLTVLSAQDDTKTTLTENEDGSITMTTTEAYCAAQIWFSDPEPVAGNVLKVELAESNVNVTVTVKYTDGTESQMSANTMVANARAMTRAVASARAATRGDSDSGTTVEVPLETGKEVQNIEVKNNVAGTITIKKMQVTTINVFTNGEANLSMLKPQSNATYDTAAHTLATTKGWTGATISPVAGENVSGKELLIEFADASKVKVAVKYRTDVEGPSTIMEKAAKAVRLALDNTKNIQEISIQPTEASIVTFTKIAVNGEETDDGSLKPGKTITLWENTDGETLAWNEVAKQDDTIGEMLQEFDELLITVSGVTEGCDWPKLFIRDANSDQAGNEVLLNDIGSFPYTVRIVLTGDMADQLKNGFCICGDGVTVTKLQVYRPEAPKTGDIHLADLNYGYNSSYEKSTYTITTTARWAARGWEIGDKRYNDKNLITVKFEPVDFPVTLKMEYTTGVQTAQATSVGVPAGRTELLLEIPKGISKLDHVYIIYENPGSVKLTEVSVTYQDNLKLSTAIKAFEADGVIRDGRYDTDGWYNLRGQRIPEPKTSGVYIHGGKKVVIY